MEKYIFDHIIFVNRKFKLFSEDFEDDLPFRRDVTKENIYNYIDEIIEFVSKDLKEYIFDALRFENNGFKVVNKIYTGNDIASKIRNFNIVISDHDIINLKLINTIL